MPRLKPSYGEGEGTPLNLVVLGDSVGKSIGVEHPEQSIGVNVAQVLAATGARPVRLRVLARFGATAERLQLQVTATLRLEPGVAMVVGGGNDALALQRLIVSARLLEGQLLRLRDAGWTVVVVTCASMGAQPALRWWVRPIARYRSRSYVKLQTMAALRAGARTVSVYDPRFARDPQMLGTDQFHPSALGYAYQLKRIVPAVVAAVQPAAEGQQAYQASFRCAARTAIRVPGVQCVWSGPGTAIVLAPGGSGAV